MRDPQLILIASGSEVSLALKAATELSAECNVRVVSMPSWELFEKQPDSYKQQVLPALCTARVAIEATTPMGWEKYIGSKGRTVCINHYGASAPYQVLEEKFGFTVANVLAASRQTKIGK